MKKVRGAFSLLMDEDDTTANAVKRNGGYIFETSPQMGPKIFIPESLFAPLFSETSLLERIFNEAKVTCIPKNDNNN